MNPEENETQQITWTITVQSSTAQAEPVQKLIDQFTNQVQAVGATCRSVQVMSMAATAVPTDRIEQVATIMRQQGMAEEQIERQRLLIMAQMGQGSWSDVVSAAEDELAAYRTKGDVPQELGSVFGLVEYAMNAGEKEKAIAYFSQAEQLLSAASVEDLLGTAGTQMPPEAQEQARQHYQRQLERLRNWLF